MRTAHPDAAAAAVHPPAPAGSPRADATPLRRRRKATRPRELLDAALALFVEKGYAKTRTDEVARDAGVSKGTLYLYYPSKEELFKAVVRHNVVGLIAEGRELVGQFQGSSSDLLLRLMTTWWARVGGSPAAGIHKIVVAEAGNFPELAPFYTAEVIAPAEALFCSAVQRGVDRGEFRALPVHEVAHALMAPLIYMALHRHSLGACGAGAVGGGGGTVDPMAGLKTHCDLVLRGLEVRPAPRRTPGPRATEPAP